MFLRIILFIFLTFCGLNLFSQKLHPENFLLLEIDGWVRQKISEGEYVPEQHCNPDSILKYYGEYDYGLGFMGGNAVDYCDFDNDGDLDCIFSYDIQQCDWGNAIWYNETYCFIVNGLVLSRCRNFFVYTPEMLQ